MKFSVSGYRDYVSSNRPKVTIRDISIYYSRLSYHVLKEDKRTASDIYLHVSNMLHSVGSLLLLPNYKAQYNILIHYVYDPPD